MTQQTAEPPAAEAVEPLEPLVGLDRGWAVWPVAVVRSAGLPFDLVDAWVAPEVLSMPPGEDRRRAAGGHARDTLDLFVSDELFRAAVTWQNPAAVDNWIGRWAQDLRAGRRPVGNRVERRATLVARYAQRYCAKNDTIGFFGPVSWARLGTSATAVHGGAAIRSRRAHLEGWAALAIARAWEAEPALADHLPAALDPACAYVDGHVRRPHRPPLGLTAAERAVVAVLDAGGTVAEVVRRSGLPAPEARAILDRLRSLRVAKVGFRVPVGCAPVAELRRSLRDVPDGVSGTLRGSLDRVEAARAAAERAVTPEEVRAALAEVERCVSAAAGGPVMPPAGRGLGKRLPVYLDCRRDLDVDVSSADLDDLREPLSILLDSARWLTGQVGRIVSDTLVECFRVLARRSGPVTLAELQFASAEILSPAGGRYAELVADFQLRWAEIIDGGPGRGPVEIPSGRARRLADALFPAGGRHWAAARAHSPDLMARRTADGSLRWVLGELHLALNTLESRVFVDQADDPDRLRARVAADLPGGRVVPVYPSDSTDVTSRTYPPPALDPDHGYRYWSFGSDDGHARGAPTAPATAMVVTWTGSDLVATGCGWAAPVLECFGEFVSAVAVNLFRPRTPRAHVPRVDLGGLTMCRESWRATVAELVPPGRSADRVHDSLRAWARERGVPRRVFARVPDDPKPFYVDFAAPALVEGLVRGIRRGAPDDPVDLAEMLPGPDELWLRLDGRRYTSELRVVCVDPEPAAPAWWPSTPDGAG